MTPDAEKWTLAPLNTSSLKVCACQNLPACIISDSLRFSIGSESLSSEADWLREGKCEGIRSWVLLKSETLFQTIWKRLSKMETRLQTWDPIAVSSSTSEIYSLIAIKDFRDCSQSNLVGWMREGPSVSARADMELYLVACNWKKELLDGMRLGGVR